jgi:hypothetical protein
MEKLIAEEIVEAILAKDKETFMAAFNAALATKVGDALEVKKVEVASSWITPEVTVEEETVVQEMKEKDDEEEDDEDEDEEKDSVQEGMSAIPTKTGLKKANPEKTSPEKFNRQAAVAKAWGGNWANVPRHIQKQHEEAEQIDEATHFLYTGTVNDSDYELTIPRHKDISDYSDKQLHRKLSNENPHLEPHEVTAIVNSGGEDESKVNVEHKGKKYTHHVINHQEPQRIYNEEVEQVGEAQTQPPLHSVINIKTGKHVGTHSYDGGFKPAPGSNLKPHPTTIPGGHRIDKKVNYRNLKVK